MSPAAPVLLQSNERRFAAEALAEQVRRKAVFDFTTARMARDAATPALGKETPRTPRAPRLTTVAVICPHCKRTGAIECRLVGEEKPPVPVFATDGFHIETGRTAGKEALVVCGACDEIIVL
ncbi:MAG: hypothetical protein WDM89_13730 [Rhizomicrobium sp.]